MEGREPLEKKFAGDEAQHGIAQKLELFIVLSLLTDISAPALDSSCACELWVSARSSSSRVVEVMPESALQLC